MHLCVNYSEPQHNLGLHNRHLRIIPFQALCGYEDGGLDLDLIDPLSFSPLAEIHQPLASVTIIHRIITTLYISPSIRYCVCISFALEMRFEGKVPKERFPLIIV